MGVAEAEWSGGNILRHMVNPRSRSRFSGPRTKGARSVSTSRSLKAPPQKTPAFWDIVDATRAPDAELVDVLDRLGNPDAVTIITIAAEGTGGFADWISRHPAPHGEVPLRPGAQRLG